MFNEVTINFKRAIFTDNLDDYKFLIDHLKAHTITNAYSYNDLEYIVHLNDNVIKDQSLIQSVIDNTNAFYYYTSGDDQPLLIAIREKFSLNDFHLYNPDNKDYYCCVITDDEKYYNDLKTTINDGSIFSDVVNSSYKSTYGNYKNTKKIVMFYLMIHPIYLVGYLNRFDHWVIQSKDTEGIYNAIITLTPKCVDNHKIHGISKDDQIPPLVDIEIKNDDSIEPTIDIDEKKLKDLYYISDSRNTHQASTRKSKDYSLIGNLLYGVKCRDHYESFNISTIKTNYGDVNIFYDGSRNLSLMLSSSKVNPCIINEQTDLIIDRPEYPMENYGYKCFTIDHTMHYDFMSGFDIINELLAELTGIDDIQLVKNTKKQ